MQGSTSATPPRGTPSRRGRSPRFSSDGSSHAGTSHLSNKYAAESSTIFASSLDILVEGAVPIKDDSSEDTESPQPTTSSDTDKRAPRKSKTDALVALNNQARASSAAPDEDEAAHSLTAKYRNAPPIPVSPTLNMSSVKTPGHRHEGKASPTSRPFGLKDCPEYYPTSEQFADPMEYIKSIAEQAKEFGICKIVPPADWKMPFVTNTETFRFKTRLQRLNSIEASSRAKLNFLEQLYQYHQQQGNPRVSVPTINHKPLDLWLLRKEVNKLGGYEAVTANRKWSDLGRILGYRGIPGLSTQIKNSYARVILPYEQFCERTRVSPTSPNAARDANVKVEGDNSMPSSPLTATSSPLSEPPDESEARDASKPSMKPRRSTRASLPDNNAKRPGSLSQPIVPPPVFYDKRENAKGTSEQRCEICHKANRADRMLLCDECDCGFHMDCLDPPIATVPADNWFCYNCLSTSGGDFGFDEGEEHSLSSFQARDLEFRRMWFEKHFSDPEKRKRLPDHMCNEIAGIKYSEYDVEEEFWRLVQSQQETVEIEYGADVHSTTHGSAMPTLETHPLEPYSKHPWNLNNIPILSESLLRYIKSEISGMTVPWTYVGMVFSTFCWHNEDHYTYSINYMHWGETKTWYGIPGQDGELFEAAIKGEAPDLFHAQPDLLFQLVTLMNPRRLTEAGVRVFACNQRAGEFVITFPKAYHAGFNHGLNFNEAVNFALPDWLPFGLACVERYREHRKLPVFSHDELLLTIAQHSTGIKTAMWLRDSIQEMAEREMAERKKARSCGLTEFLSEEDRPEDQYQCAICKAFCYLSHVTCRCGTKVVCVDHVDLLCDKPHPPTHVSLRKRIDDADLQKLLDKIVQSAGIPSQWNAKFNRALTESARPALRHLRAILAEGDRINYPLLAMTNLRKCITQANDWVDFANQFLIRKQSKKRPRKSRARNDSVVNSDDPGDRPDQTLAELYAHLKQADGLGFDCPEIGHLQNLVTQVESIKEKAGALLERKVTEDEDDQKSYLSDCKRLLLDGSSLNVILEELNEVEKIVERDVLVKELSEKLDDQDSVVTLEEVRKLLSRARACGLAPDSKYVCLLEERESEGGRLEQRAKDLHKKPIKTIAELEEFADTESSIPIDMAIQKSLNTHLAKARDYEKQACAWMKPEAGAVKPRLPDVFRLITRAESGYDIGAIATLKSTAEIASDFEGRCEQIIRGQLNNNVGDDFLESVSQWCDYAKEHLTMFSLPFFDKVTAQLELHNAWIRELPWHCTRHGSVHGSQVLNDVIECTRPEEDLPPNDEFLTCICNNPVNPPPHGGSSDAVQCDHCGARFHGDCAKNGGSCPFCDHHHWNGSIPKERSWHFCFLPALLTKAPDISRTYAKEYKQLEIIVHRVDRLSASIGHFLAFTSQPANQRPEYISHVRHYMRKLYKIQFAVSPNPEVSFGLDLAGLHRILAGRPLTNGGAISSSGSSKRSRRPKFTFVLDVDPDGTDSTRCFCRGHPPPNHYLGHNPTITCGHCKRRYHTTCVLYPPSSSPQSYLCPLCCLRKNKSYPYCDVRVRLPESTLESGIYVNIQEMIATHSRELMFIKMGKPTATTLFVELVDFTPGTPDETLSSNSSHSRSYSHEATALSHSRTPPLPSNANGSNHSIPVHAHPQSLYAPPTAHIQPPPPPWSSNNWSRWGTVSTPAQPPSTNHRRHHADIPRPIQQPPPQNHVARKRKHEDIILQPPIDDRPRTSGSASSLPPAPKRRALSGSVTPVSPPPRSLPPVSPPPIHNQSLSPSLRKLMADPTPDIPTSSPRAPYNIPPIRQNGTDGRSPTLPSVTSLMSGMPSK
ncbi:Lysine-specific demethylase 5A [Leucoagaricus sp. SymC.cos]|nr:Lysine-specific demethylase 5A [Leucoagaricus sp. SymC.cos]